MSITPSAEAIISLIIVQEQGVGIQIDFLHGGGRSVVRPDAYQGGSVKFWIDKNSYLPVKVEFKAEFEGNIEGAFDSAALPTTNPVTSIFIGQLIFQIIMNRLI